MTAEKSVVAALSAVMADVQAIRKGQKNTAPNANYMFRGIDAVMNAVGPALRTHGVVIVPECVESHYRDVQTSTGKPSREATVTVTYRAYGPAGDSIVMQSAGEAMDSGDKATNKAMSIAYKYAAFLAFCIPVEGMAADADETVHSVKPSKPHGYAPWIATLEGTAEQGKAALREAFKLGTREMVDYLKEHDGDTLTALTDKANSAANAA